ncbi:hypothetical protein BDW75DRAFT_215596 [Aspergillus navahoensis]
MRIGIDSASSTYAAAVLYSASSENGLYGCTTDEHQVPDFQNCKTIEVGFKSTNPHLLLFSRITTETSINLKAVPSAGDRPDPSLTRTMNLTAYIELPNLSGIRANQIPARKTPSHKEGRLKPKQKRATAGRPVRSQDIAMHDAIMQHAASGRGESKNLSNPMSDIDEALILLVNRNWRAKKKQSRSL